MDKGILIEYAEMKEEIKDLRRRIEKIQKELDKLHGQIVVDSVSCGKKGKKTLGMYRMLKKHETILEDVLKRLIRIIIRLGIVTGNTLDQNTDVVIDFDDSIIEDKGAERQQDRQDVSMGVMRHEEYRAKWYGETVEQAKKNLPEQNQVME